MTNSILLAVNDSMNSRAAVDYIVNLALCPDDSSITLLHILRKPSAGEELMGKKFMNEQPDKFQAILEKAKNNLIEGGYHPNSIKAKIITEPYSTVSDGIIDQFKKGDYSMVMIGRKRMSKAEEFVLGDPSIRLVRALEGTAVMVVKS